MWCLNRGRCSWIYRGLHDIVKGSLVEAGVCYRYLMMLFFLLFWARIPYSDIIGDFLPLIYLFLVPGCFAGLVYPWFYEPADMLVGFIPEGIDWRMAIVICWLETISYLVRPFVMVFRPVVNIVGGTMVMHIIYGSLKYWGKSTSSANGGFFESLRSSLGLVFQFSYVSVFLLYEWCVCCVQWYIIKILINLDMVD